MEGRNAFILRLAPLGQDMTQEALEKDEIRDLRGVERG
jgi:hypothetical protein